MSINKLTENPEFVFAKLNCGRPVALFGRAKDDPRYNAETGAFSDGHRLVTSPITAVKDGKYYTENTIYRLDEKTKNAKFQKWCEANQYQKIGISRVREKEEQGGMLLRHICENCGKDEILSSEDAYKLGWDYPPKMGDFTIISPRTCGECGIETTLWWEITCNKTPVEQLSEKHRQTLQRILTEPESIFP
ncbi:MAG: hypothetical protein RBT41_00030 [Clostridia bacterium]|jgi:hypothetical protein|nr:hypothetical protein [Clostridia bacterium]